MEKGFLLIVLNVAKLGKFNKSFKITFRRNRPLCEYYLKSCTYKTHLPKIFYHYSKNGILLYMVVARRAYLYFIRLDDLKKHDFNTMNDSPLSNIDYFPTIGRQFVIYVVSRSTCRYLGFFKMSADRNRLTTEGLLVYWTFYTNFSIK